MPRGTPPARAVFRADGSAREGSGHVMRCLTLARELIAQGVECSLVYRALDEGLRKVIASVGVEPCSITSNGVQDDAVATLSTIGDAQRTTVLLDSYRLGLVWERLVTAAGARVACLEDLAGRRHSADLLMDQNYYPCHLARYAGRTTSHTRLLLGPSYALVRPEFREGRDRPRSGSIGRVLVYLGGGPAAGPATATVLKGLEDLPHLRADVVVGFTSSGVARRGSEGDARVRFWRHLSPPQMAELMAAADLFIGGAGGTTWERACLGLPSVVVTTSAGQEESVRALEVAGAVLWAGNHDKVSPESIASLVRRLLSDPGAVNALSLGGKALVDGLGAQRVANAITGNESPCDTVFLSQFEPRHVERTLSWVSDPGLRADFLLRNPITRDGNKAFFRAALEDQTQRFYAITLGGEHVGNAGLRCIDRRRQEAEVWLYIGSALHRGQGVGGVAFAQLVREAARCLGLRSLHLRVAENNEVARALYVRQGFKVERRVNGDQEREGVEQPVLLMTKEIGR